MTTSNTTKENVKDYYGKILHSTEDLKTSACCISDSMPDYLKKLIGNIHDEVLDKFYGCGSPIPHALDGKTVLDLGSGSGRDVYIISQLVGEGGKAIGVDMTDEQLSVANKYIGYHTDKFGYSRPNTEFHKGYIEDLKTIGIEDNSVDVVISNCVINLSPEKEKVFSEIFRVLKSGGELYFSDVFSSRRIPKNIREDSIIHGECLGGAMYIEDFRRMMEKVGCMDYRVVSNRKFDIEDTEIEKVAGMIDFYSITVRAFKCDFEDICEDYGHVAYYKGTIPESVHSFTLDDHHQFKVDQPVLVCGNTAKMLTETRYRKHFIVNGNFKTHLGIFNCSSQEGTESEQSSCC